MSAPMSWAASICWRSRPRRRPASAHRLDQLGLRRESARCPSARRIRRTGRSRSMPPPRRRRRGDGAFLCASVEARRPRFRFFTVYGPWGRPDMALRSNSTRAIDGRASPIEVYGQGRCGATSPISTIWSRRIVRLIGRPPVGGEAPITPGYAYPGRALPGGQSGMARRST